MPNHESKEISALGGHHPIIHLRNPDGTSRFLHPFGEDIPYPNGEDVIPVYGLFGKEPKVEALRWFRDSLFSEIETQIDRLVLEKSFIPRFLIASAGFLLVFLFTSLIIRDPIPLVDEFLIAGAAGILIYFFLRRRSGYQKEGVDRKIICRQIIDSVQFEYAQGIESLENLWHRIVDEAPVIDQDDLETWLVSLIPGSPFELDREIYHLIQKRVKKKIGNRLSRDLEVMLFRLLRGELLEARQRVKLLRLITSTGGSVGNYTVALYAALLLDRSVK